MIWDDGSIKGDHADWFGVHDPLFRLGRAMIADGAVTQDQIAGIDREATETMKKAKDFALSSPFPDLETIPDYVLARAGGN
jgi:TPP-dependent pyruvate/acetoin dehydrogenase alpha subunit